jgi:hypothetical protein
MTFGMYHDFFHCELFACRSNAFVHEKSMPTSNVKRMRVINNTFIICMFQSKKSVGKNRTV